MNKGEFPALAIVTGATSGIGRAIAIRLDQMGIVVVASGRNEERMHGLISESKAGMLSVCGDLNKESVRIKLRDVAQGCGAHSTLLVNCVGIAQFGDFVEMDGSLVTEQIETNLFGPMLLTQLVLPILLDQGGGQIINISSIAASHAFPGADAYCASKAALSSFGRTLLAGYRQKGLRLTNLHVGSVDTPIWDTQSFSPDRSEMMLASDVADAVEFLVLGRHAVNVDEMTIMPRAGIF